MHESEDADKENGGCRFKPYRVNLRLDTGQRIDEIDTYVANVGPASMDGAPLALKEVEAIERNLIELSQREMQCALRDRIAPQIGLNAFVLGNCNEKNKEKRRKRDKRLKNLVRSP